MDDRPCPRCGKMNLPHSMQRNERLNKEVEFVYYSTCSYCGKLYVDREDVGEKNLTEHEKHDTVGEKKPDDAEKSD